MCPVGAAPAARELSLFGPGTAVRVVCAGRNAARGDSHRGGGRAHLNPTAMSTKPQQHCRSGWTPSIGQNRVPLPGCRDMQSSVSSQARHGRALKTPRVRAPRAQALCKPTVTLRRLLSTAQHRTHRRARGKPGAHHVATPNFSPQTQVTQKGRGATTAPASYPAQNPPRRPSRILGLPLGGNGERLPGGGGRPLKAS